MISRKPAILIYSSAGFYPLAGSGSQAPSPRCRYHKDPDRATPRRKQRRKAYTTAAGSTTPDSKDEIPWSELAPSRRKPTPYEIFSQRRNEPYSKHRFYQLVKLYHPDRFAHANAANVRASRAIMLDRYRMIIAANAILSDPVKRRAYDIYGFGWASGSDVQYPSGGSAASGTHYGRGHRWSSTANSAQWTTDPMSNATWEDWERWYRSQAMPRRRTQRGVWGEYFTQQGGAPPHPLLANKHALFSLVFIFAILGGIGNATRAKGWSNQRNQRAQLVHDETSRDLMATRQSTLDRMGETKDERIARFLREREGYEEGEVDGRLMREGDDGFCASGAVKDQGRPPFWQRPPER